MYSPNGDGINDQLQFTKLEYYPICEIKFYNRWEEIYESEKYQETEWRCY
jgi:gliding motility-associated-like protein